MTKKTLAFATLAALAAVALVGSLQAGYERTGHLGTGEILAARTAALVRAGMGGAQ